MSIDSQMEREIDDFDEQLASGEISTQEYNKEFQEVQREARGYIEQEAMDAYNNVMDQH